MYYYMHGKTGMTSSGSFSRDHHRWITFTEDEKTRLERNAIKPYGATREGRFVDAEYVRATVARA